MRFERLEVLNFASYYGEHVLDLSCTPEKPVIVVLGGTGYGKTSLFDAINWALYGKDYERELIDRRDRTILDYVNESALRDGETEQQFIEMSCTLYFEHNGVHYYITQSLAANPHRDSGGSLKADQTDRITTLYEIKDSGNHHPIRYDALFLDEILPNNVKDYFLFDGDRIYNLSLPGSSQEVREAIYRVVDLELVANAGEHLAQVAIEYRRTANRKSKGALSNVDDKYNAEHKRLEQLKEQLRVLREEENAIEAQLTVIEEKLKNLTDTSELQGRRSTLGRRLKQIGLEQESIRANIRSYAATAALGFARDPALNLVEVLDSKRNKGEIPKAVSQTLLKDLLKLQRCICGSEFQEGDELFQTLTARLEQERAKSSDQGLIDLLFALQQASNSVDEAVQRLKKEDENLHRLDEERRETNLEIDQIDQELDKLPKEDVSKLVTESRQRRNDLVTNKVKMTRTLEQMTACEANIKEYQKQREELSQQQEEVRQLQLRERLAQQAADEIEEIYEIFAEDSRQAVEELTIQEFKQFVHSASAYHVALSKDYELEVLDSNGNRALQRLSMGQSQCLSLSFITAISRVSEKNPPLVIDMPFGRLDQKVHQAVSARLPEITSQLILFLIPNIEWNETTVANLENKASHIHELEFDENQRQTTIVGQKASVR